MAESLILVGAVAGAFGVRGEVRLKSFCAEPEDVASYGPLLTEDGARSFDVRLIRAVKGGFAARLSGVATREQAEALRGTGLHVPRDRLPGLEDDEYYHADLIGLEVRDPGGALLGTVHAIFDHGAGDILEVRAPGAKPLLLPFTRAAVPTVDVAARRIVADPPPGLLGDDDDEEADP